MIFNVMLLYTKCRHTSMRLFKSNTRCHTHDTHTFSAYLFTQFRML